MLIRRNTIWASEGRSSFHAYVLREVLKHENKPEIIVDRGFCTGFTKAWFKIQTRLVNAVEEFFSRFKGRKDSGIDFHSGVLLTLCRAGWRVLWLSITTGGVYLDTLTLSHLDAYGNIKIFNK